MITMNLLRKYKDLNSPKTVRFLTKVLKPHITTWESKTYALQNFQFELLRREIINKRIETAHLYC